MEQGVRKFGLTLTLLLSSCSPAHYNTDKKNVLTEFSQVSQTPSSSTSTPFPTIQSSFLNDFQDYMTQKRREFLEQTGDPRISLSYNKLLEDLFVPTVPQTLSQDDFDYFFYKKRIEELTNPPNKNFFSYSSNFYFNTILAWEKIKNHQPKITEEEWERYYSQYQQLQKEKTGDAGIFLKQQNPFK